MAAVVLDAAEVIIRFGSAGDGTVAVIILYRRHHHPCIGGVNPVLVERHGVEQGVMRPQPLGVQLCGIECAQHSQRTVRPGLDVGIYVIEHGFRLPAATAGGQ